MKQEDNILRKVGTGNPFKVPEGYFENLTSEVMNKLPEKEKTTLKIKEPTMWDRVKPWIYMAAMFAGAALIIRVASGEHKKTDEVAVSTDMEDQYINTVLSGSMIDDYSLYVYLTDAGAEN